MEALVPRPMTDVIQVVLCYLIDIHFGFNMQMHNDQNHYISQNRKVLWLLSLPSDKSNLIVHALTNHAHPHEKIHVPCYLTEKKNGKHICTCLIHGHKNVLKMTTEGHFYGQDVFSPSYILWFVNKIAHIIIVPHHNTQHVQVASYG